jgi:uncharacterized protein (TIGR02996 family)
MTLETKFLDAIVADPADDARRLVYADWLDEHSQPERAEFIRGQVQLACEKEDSILRRRLARRMRELVETHEQEWLSAMTPYLRSWHFGRGFVDKIAIDARVLEEHTTEIFSSMPLTRLRMLFMDVDMEDPERLPIPEANTLTGLDLTYNSINSGWLACLAATTFPRLPRVRHLSLMFNHLDDECVPLLCAHPFFRQLPLLRCGANPITNAGREQLRRHFGERISFVCERDDDHLYSMQDDYLTVGYGPDDTQLLIRAWDGVQVAVFDFEGNLLEIMSRDVPNWVDWKKEQQEGFKHAWLRELGFNTAPIKFKRFTFRDREGVNDFNEHLVKGFDDWNQPEAADARGEVGLWLFDGHFEWNNSRRRVWFSGKGEVIMA